MKKYCRTVFIILSVAFIFLLMYSSVFIISKHGHECCSKGCVTCYFISVADAASEYIPEAPAAITVAITVFTVCWVISFITEYAELPTPVQLKVKLTD